MDDPDIDVVTRELQQMAEVLGETAAVAELPFALERQVARRAPAKQVALFEEE